MNFKIAEGEFMNRKVRIVLGFILIFAGIIYLFIFDLKIVSLLLLFAGCILFCSNIKQ